jgi:hypothetical protein
VSPQPADVARAVAQLARECGREDLAQRLRGAAARATRPTTIICVVGEFKQGKSTLINALLGSDLCPVDDDLATSALTLVTYGETTSVTVRRRGDDGSLVAETVEPSSLRDWVTEEGNPDNGKHVERVDVQAPSPLLAEGVGLVDTPGAGGLSAGYATATLAFLPFADGLIFVSDASSELSAPEMEFLASARERCSTVVFALTKTDLYAEWRRIAALDRDHLDAANVRLTEVNLSAPLRAEAVSRNDAELDQRSGYPELLRIVREQVVAPARATASVNVIGETDSALDQLEQTARQELGALSDPGRVAAELKALQHAQARLAHLRGPGARWSTLVADRVADLSNDANFRFRAAMREILREMDEGAEQLNTAADWDALALSLQNRVAEAVSSVFRELDQGGRNIRDAAFELLAEESLFSSLAEPTRSRIDVGRLWRPRTTGKEGSSLGGTASTAFTGLRGAMSGMMLFGMLGRFVPAGAAAIMLSNPVTLGLGAAFAGIQLVDSHRRRLAARRQQARTEVRQFLDDVQFEVSNRIGEVVRDLQRALRDEFTEMLAELSRTYTDMAARSQQAAQASRAQADERSAALNLVLARIGDARAALSAGSKS